MTKLLSASLLAFGLMAATPAAVAQPITGIDHLYIQDTSAPITFTYGGLDGRHQSYAWDSIVVWVGTVDSNGNFVDDWAKLFQTKGSKSDVATLVFGSSSLTSVQGDPYSFTFNASADAVELVFKWTDLDTGKTYYSDLLGKNPYAGGKMYTQVVYSSSDRVQLGLEDANGSWDRNDILVTMTNVGATAPTPTIPEPESYAMMLAGLSLVGVVARRRRNKSQ